MPDTPGQNQAGLGCTPPPSCRQRVLCMGRCGQAGLSAQRRLQPDSCKDTAHLFSTRPFPCGLPGWAGQTFCFSGVKKNNVFPVQHVKNGRAVFSVLAEGSLALPSPAGKSGAEQPSSVNLFPQQQQTKTDHTQVTVRSGDELSRGMKRSSCLR